jgi:hypothetical protein
MGRWIDLTPLTACRALTHVDVHIRNRSFNIDGAHFEQVRALGHVRSMQINCMMHGIYTMTRLLAEPHTLQWHDIGWIDSPSILERVRALPSLTHIRCNGRILSKDVLMSFPHLQRLTIYDVCHSWDFFDGCPHLTDLTLTAQVTDTFEWTRHPRLTQSLRTLTVRMGQNGATVPTHIIRHFHHFRSLRELNLDSYAFSTDLASSTEFIELKLPSSVMPSLEKLCII